MKKFLFSLATVVAMATGGFLGYSSADSDSKLSSVMLANIEALANNEGGQLSIMCYTDLKYVGDPWKMFALCSTCSFRGGYIPAELSQSSTCVPPSSN